MKKTDILNAIDNIKSQLVEKYRPAKIILFGSAARGDEEINDIDLFIVKKDVPHLGADRISQLYRLTDADVPVDFLVYRPEEVDERISKGDPFIKKIFREGKVLYG